ncbi:mitochondrial carrier protein [Trichophyton violaceum]|uniref:Mitochondrial carrier protein n=1 Tax=Trichophyton violaceum TaxID=34388 RepID=A0A178FFG6_TRIVO|nr:mitochondrial carrier protein [Trichophyton violaceum]
MAHSSKELIQPTIISSPQLKPKPDNDFVKSLSHLVAGATGGAITAVLTSPLDVLRTRLQSDFYRPVLSSTASPKPMQQPAFQASRPMLGHIRETFQILFSIYHVEGWRGLFRGLGPNLTGVVPASAIKYYTYGNVKRIIGESQIFGPNSENAMGCHIISAVTAGITTGTLTSPIWVIKTRLQLDKSQSANSPQAAPRRYKNSFDCARQVLRQEGPRGLYRGLSASYLGSLETTFHLALYEQLKMLIVRMRSNQDEPCARTTGNKTLGDRLSGLLGMGGAAALSKFLSSIIAYPHEVIRTRLRQAPMANGHVKYTGVVQCFRLLCREEGFRALYGGLTPHLLRSIPSAGITLGVYEAVLEGFKLLSED